MERNNLFWFGLFVELVGLVFWLLPTFFPESMEIFLLLASDASRDTVMSGNVMSNPFFRLGWAISGALMVGLGITFVAISQPPTNGPLSTKNLLYLALESWYILDSLTSAITGFYLNIVSNTGFLILGLLALRSYFSGKEGRQKSNLIHSNKATA